MSWRHTVGLVVAAAATVSTASLPGAARATTFDAAGTILFGGRPTFPIVLSPGPPLGSKTPWGTNALTETTLAGVDVFRVGPGGTWTSNDIRSALAWDRAAAARHAYTWVNLSGYSQALPGSRADAAMAKVVSTVTSEPSSTAVAMWRGRDEPWWSHIARPALQFAYCRVTSRGDPSWCDGEPALDPAPLWVTIEAPQGTVYDLATYSFVTDVHGVDVYPITLADASPDLHKVGRWTARLASITLGPVWTTLQICSHSSHDTSGAFVLPSFRQERYMAYDAIVNGARALAFYGGNIRGCWTPRDAGYGWNWTFWQNVLRPLVAELSASSRIAPALVSAGTSRPVTTTDPTTEAILREGTSVDDLWLIAARSGAGVTEVAFGGLPAWAHKGSVYRENRAVTARAGHLGDSFGQWDVHVYHFVEPLALRAEEPPSATVASQVLLRGKGLAAATAVHFDGIDARFTIRSDTTLVATVPRKARSGPVVIRSALRRVRSASSFIVRPSPASPPRIAGTARVGHILKATTGRWYGDPPTSYRFRWLRCNVHGARCRLLPRATTRTLWLGSEQVGKRFRVRVVAHTPHGSAHARSASTAVVRP